GLNGPPSLLNEGTIFGAGQYRFFPNLSINKLGEVMVAFAFSSATDYAGVRARAIGGSADQTVKVGQVTIDGSRYGDYAGPAVDPDGCRLWQLEEYAKSRTTWGSWISPLTFSDCAGSVSATPTNTPVKTATAVN